MTLSRRTILAAAAVAPVSAATRWNHSLTGIRRENLKITDVKVTLMSCELKDKAWVTANQLIWKSDAVLVEVFTDKGIVGIGESSPYGGPEFLKKTIEEMVKPTLLGQNPVRRRAPYYAGGAAPRPNYAVWAGIDAACWDIIGKAVHKPVFELLGRRWSRSRTSACTPPAASSTPGTIARRRLIEEAVRHKEDGYTAFKFRIGTEWKNSGMTIQQVHSVGAETARGRRTRHGPHAGKQHAAEPGGVPGTVPGPGGTRLPLV